MPSSSSQQTDGHSRFELQTLLETSRLLAESHNMDFVLNNLLLITMGKLMVSRGLVLLFEPAHQHYIVSKSKGQACLAEDTIIEFEDLQIQQQAVISCADTGMPIPELIRGDDSCTLFNLQTQNQHIGFLCLGSKGDGRPLRQHEIEFVESLSIISSVAITNSRMFDELKQINRKLDRKVYELNTLLDLSKDFNQLVDRQEILRIFKFAMLGQLLVRDFFFILEQHGQRSMAASNSIQGALDQEDIGRLFSLSSDIVEVDETLAKQIPFLEENDIQALVALHFQNKKIAVIGVGKRANKAAYTPADFNFLQSLGNLAVLSIQKTLLLEERIEKERIEEELDIAKSIQKGLLPNPVPQHAALDIAAKNISSQQVGGDYFDILETPRKELLFVIADVTGKGTPAALLMANLQAMIHVLLSSKNSLEQATERINDMIYQNTPSDKFVTFFWSVFNPKNKQLRYVNAGHNPPLYFSAGEEQPLKLEKGGVILGAVPTMAPYERAVIKLKKGDLLVFYTDGVTEAMNPGQTEEYEEERLIRCIQKHRHQSAEAILQAVIDDVNTYAANIQYDDITLIAFKVL